MSNPTSTAKVQKYNKNPLQVLVPRRGHHVPDAPARDQPRHPHQRGVRLHRPLPMEQEAQSGQAGGGQSGSGGRGFPAGGELN